MLHCTRFAAFLLAIGLLASSMVQARAAVPELLAYRTIPAADGSVAIELDFDTFAPQFQVIHAKRNDVKVVLGDVQRGPNLPGVLGKSGTMHSGVIVPFPGVGLVVDLQLESDVRPRAESAGNRIVVHIPAATGDEEAHFTLPMREANEGVTMMRLSYADVSEVAGLIKDGLTVPSVNNFTAQSPFAAPPQSSSSSSSSSYSSSAAQNAMPQAVTIPTYALLPKDSAQGVYVNPNVSVDRRLNAVILRGTPEEIAPYERMISLIDTPRRTVLLQTQIVELTETAALDLGIDYSAGGHLVSASASIGNNTNTFNNSNGQPVTQPLTKASASATIDALASKGEAKILAQPQILATDNRIAAILSGEAVPILTTITVPSGGTTLLQQQLQYINVGVSLEILPRIAANGDVTADLFSEVSSIIDYVQNYPRIAVRQELTAVSVGDGQSVLIGGLLQDTEIKNLSKIPGLGDIPLLGAFFRETQTSHQKTNLYLVITPHVLTKSTFPKSPQ